MLDRESTFADPQIIRLLTDQFIPVAIDQWYTRRQQDTEGEFYREIASQGPRNDFTKTTQGLYIADAAGSLLGFNNNRGPERIRAMLADVAASYQAPKIDPITRVSVDSKYHPPFPDGVAVLRVSAKVLNGYDHAESRWDEIFQNAISRDNAWVTADEQQELLAGEFPLSLARRIARFHLVDNTRGEPPTWRLNEIRELTIELHDGKITGSVHLQTADGERGFRASIHGIVDASHDRLEQMELLCEGEFWGTGPFTMQPPEDKFPLAVAFRLADGSDIADSIPPHASRGWIDGYLHPDR